MPAVTPADVHTSTVADVDGIGVDLDGGEGLGQQVARAPMRGGALAVEQAGLGEHEGTRAHAGDAASPLGEAGDVRHEVGVGHRVVGAVAADHDERVDGSGHVGDGLVGDDRHAAGRRQRAGGGGGEACPVHGSPDLLVGPCEHLGGPEEVEALQLGEHDEHDLAGLHDLDPAPSGRWRQCRIPNRSSQA